MAFSAQDEHFMRQALDLALRGSGLTSPGARVGAVIIDSAGQFIGTGFYTFDGVKHAEVLALEQAGNRARGGAIYLNLEPHCHQGRTPPCTDAIIAAGIKRVVAAMADPNPKVAGKGFEQLRAAGIAVESGLFEAEARRMNESFAKYILTRRPLITLKSGMTLDGKIAPPPGDSFNPSALGATSAPSPQQAKTGLAGGPTGGWITSDEARAHVQQLRHESDAIMVGVGTIIADGPLLTAPPRFPPPPPLIRGVVASAARPP